MPTFSFELPDDSFWSGIDNLLPKIKAEARKSDFRGIHLEGPRIVDLDRHTTLPLFGLRRASLEEAFYLRLDTRAVIAGVSQTDNSVFAEMAWKNKSVAPEDFTPPKEGFPEGASISPFEIEVRERLRDLPWTPGGKTFILYLFDQQSNPVEILFQSDAPKGSKSRILAQPESHMLIHPDPNSAAGHSFVKQPESPAIPITEGISLRIVLGPEGASAQKCIAHGAFRLKPLAGEILNSRAAISIPGIAPGTSAILPITLLVLGENLPGPFLFPIRCPAIPTAEKGIVVGYFNVNLLKMPKMFGVSQRYVARALHGNAHSEPEKFSLK